MIATDSSPKIAVVRMPALNRLWGGGKVTLRPQQRVVRQISQQVSDAMQQEQQRNQWSHLAQPSVATNRAVNQGDWDDLMTKVAIRLPGLADVASLRTGLGTGMPRLRGAFQGAASKLRGAMDEIAPRARGYLDDPMGTRLRQRGLDMLRRPGGGATATRLGSQALRSGKLRQVATPAAGAAGLGAIGAAAMGEGEEDRPAPSQQRLQQRLDSPVGGLLEDILNPETEQMAAARQAKREELGDNVSLMQRWQLMDPSMRTLLVSLLLGGGMGLAGAMTR